MYFRGYNKWSDDFKRSGKMIEKWWLELENKFTDIEIDEFVIMPNHVHGIIINIGCGQITRGQTQWNKGEHIGSPLHRIVQWFKTMTTNEYIRCVKQFHLKRFDRKLWQRNYYEHIIRNEAKLNKIREYIINNPIKWDIDIENPRNIK